MENTEDLQRLIIVESQAVHHTRKVKHVREVDQVLQERVAERAAKTPGRVDDNPETVEKLIKDFDEKTQPLSLL